MTATVGELEEWQKQRASLQQWITEQNAVVADWRSRPSKLRPEAARAELVAMQELKGEIGERRGKLLTASSGVEDAEPRLEDQLNKLETDVSTILVLQSGDDWTFKIEKITHL